MKEAQKHIEKGIIEKVKTFHNLLNKRLKFKTHVEDTIVENRSWFKDQIEK